FTNIATLTASDQSTCPCSESISDVSFSSHKTCQPRSDGSYQVECWDGYYLDKDTNSCLKACPTGYSLDESDSTSETCIEDSEVTEDNTVRCQICSLKENIQAVVESGSSAVTCGCSLGWYGETCVSDMCLSDSDCRDHETCAASGECVCADDWYMSPLGYCIYDSSGACSGCGATGSYGTCEFVTSDTEMSCKCEDDWYGDACSSGCPIVDAMICSNHGTCNDSDHICECDTGYI
ncbi:hypothetical protein ADUPG1_001843, partial [Aduncisulcus paluster]